MQNRQNYSTEQAPRFTAHIFSILLLLIACCSISPAQSSDSVQEYVFSSIADNLFENPANWSPAYPGNVIPRNAVVFIEGTAYLTGYDLHIQGALRIGIGANLQAASNEVVVAAGGRLINDGELMAGNIRNYGTLNNNLSASVDLKNLQTFAGSMTNNLMAAEFLIRGDAVNCGVFNNYSRCTIENEFENKAVFNQLSRSELRVKGSRIDLVYEETGVEAASFSQERP